jgi:hypothetical protein
MKPEWKAYMMSVGLTEALQKRAEEVLLFFEEIHPDAIEEIFITEYPDKEGNRQYESLWLFSKDDAMEAKRFLHQDNFDSTPLAGQVKYWTVQKTEYDFRQASSQSRMTLQFSLQTGIGGILRGSQQNCDHLKKIFLNHILPNTAKLTGSTKHIESTEGDLLG